MAFGENETNGAFQDLDGEVEGFYFGAMHESVALERDGEVALAQAEDGTGN